MASNPPTSDEGCGMIWQEEVIKDRRRGRWTAFYMGVVFGAVVMAFVFIWIVKATGGCQ